MAEITEMKEAKAQTDPIPAPVPESDEFIVELSKTYNFEGEKISRIDLSGLQDMTVNDMIQVNKRLNASGSVSILPENDLNFAIHMAARASEIPVEFFLGLAPRDGVRVKAKVTSVFFASD